MDVITEEEEGVEEGDEVGEGEVVVVGLVVLVLVVALVPDEVAALLLLLAAVQVPKDVWQPTPQ